VPYRVPSGIIDGMQPTLKFAPLFIVTLLTAQALAVDSSDDLRLDRPTFPKGTTVVTSWASIVPPIRYSDDWVTKATVGVGYYFWNNHSLNINAHGMVIDQEGGESAQGTELSIMGRYHFFNRDKLTVYLDGGIGYTWLDSPEPKGGTTYNFNPLVGLGAGYQLSDNVWLIGGARYFHMSNARQHGPDKNPGYDGVECYVGVLVTLN